MAREDKGSATSSFQDAPSGKSGDLAARRARLRGTLSKQSLPPDTYGNEPANGAAEDQDDNEPTNGAASESRTTLPSTTYSQAPVPVLPIETVNKDKNAKSSSDSVIPESPTYSTNPIAGYTASPAVGTNPVAGGGAPGRSTSASTSASAKESKAEAFSLESLQNSGGSSADKSGSDKKTDSKATNAAATPAASETQPAHASQDAEQLAEALSGLDMQLGICSVNLAQLSKSATEQLEMVKNLTEVVQNQAFGEIGLSLSSLSESMSAALEPMKAVGELVPAIDNLVLVIEKGATKNEAPKLTPDELVMSLANQLNNQQIDPWTFKCAYMAVFPSEHPADLLKKLVELLGTQTISGDLFRQAYDAVQAPDPPPRPVYAPPAQPTGEEPVREIVREVVTVVQDEAVMAQIEELRRFNEDLRGRMDQREAEYAEMLAAKDSEVQESQAMLNARFEEFNARHEEVSEMVRQRNEILAQRDNELQQKETQLQQKDSELQILRNQLEEMRSQTKDMVADLQKQLAVTQQAVEEAAKAKAAAPLTKAQTNFFEATGSQSPPAQANQLFGEPAPQPTFNAAPSAPFALAGQAPQLAVPQAAPQPVPQPVPQPAPAPPPQPMPEPAVASSATATQAELQPISEPVGLAANLAPSASSQSVSTQAIPRPQVSAPTTPMMGTGSYGSGVRAQVFEVIVRQALAGAPWREICAGPMQVNNISPDEVEAEVKRRQALLKK